MCSQGMVQFVSRFAEPVDAEYAPPVVEGETLVRCVFCLITCQGFVFYVLNHADLQQPIGKGMYANHYNNSCNLSCPNYS